VLPSGQYHLGQVLKNWSFELLVFLVSNELFEGVLKSIVVHPCRVKLQLGGYGGFVAEEVTRVLQLFDLVSDR
jgi:hypothetical protein